MSIELSYDTTRSGAVSCGFYLKSKGKIGSEFLESMHMPLCSNLKTPFMCVLDWSPASLSEKSTSKGGSRVPINAQVCVLYTQFFGKVRPWDAGKNWVSQGTLTIKTSENSGKERKIGEPFPLERNYYLQIM